MYIYYKMVKEIKRNYYLNLFSILAEKTLNSDKTKNVQFKWNIRDLQLGSVADIALVQIIHKNAGNGIGYTFRMLETYADGYDNFNQTSAIVYMGMGLNQISVPTYHKLISNNLNTITIVPTDTNFPIPTNAEDITTVPLSIYSGISTNIEFAVVLHIVDYVDNQNTY